MDNNVRHWDAAAANYQQVYSGGSNDYNERLMHFITNELGLCSSASILDIGCGVGKYGIALAKLGYDVTVTDISPRMIEFARLNAAAAAVSIEAVCANWENVTVSENWLKKGFDLVMSTMSPAIHDEASLKKVLSITNNACIITNFMKFEHVTANRICSLIGLPNVQRFAVPAKECRNIFDLACKAGCDPQLQVVPYNWSDRRTCEEMAEKLLSQYELSVTRSDLISAVKTLCDADGLIEDSVHTQVAWVWWKKRKV